MVILLGFNFTFQISLALDAIRKQPIFMFVYIVMVYVHSNLVSYQFGNCP